MARAEKDAYESVAPVDSKFRLISTREACELLGGIGRGTFLRVSSEPGFPKSIRMGTRSCYWMLRSVEEFISRRERAARRRRAELDAGPPFSLERMVNDKTLPEYVGIPDAIREIAGLCEAQLPKVLCGIYFLCFRGEVVYVGQSLCVPTRIAGHALEGRKRFDRAYYVACPKEHLDRVERELIDQLLPRYNRDFLTNRARRARVGNPVEVQE